MITLAKKRAINVKDVLQRSPVAGVPGAEGILKDCLWRSVEIWEGDYNGEAACVWGLIPPTIISDAAYIWLLTTDIIDEHKFLFIRHSQEYVKVALKVYPVLYGEMVGNNPMTKRWLKWLGAEFGQPVGNKTPFAIRRKVLNG